MKGLRVIFGVVMLLAGLNLAAQNEAANTKAMPVKKGSKYGKDSIKCLTNLNLYADYYKQWKATKYKQNDLAETSIQYWRYCFLECPRARQNVYSRGAKLMRYKIKTTKDSLTRERYIDTLMMVYENRIKYFPNNPKYPVGYLRGRQAVDLWQFRKDSPEQYYPLFKEAYELQGNKLDAGVLLGYFLATVKYWQAKKCDIDLVYETYMEVYDVLQYNIENSDEKAAKKYKAASDKIESIMVKIAKCDKLVEVFEPKFDKDPSDTVLAKNLVRLFELRHCTDADLYYKALKEVDKIAPDASSKYCMGKMSLERKKYAEAIEYLKAAVELIPDSNANRKADAYLLMADAYKSTGKLAESRIAARKVLEYRPDDPLAYITIGDLYIKSASTCKFKGLSVAYWAAADKYAKAISVAKDEKLKAAAQEALAKIKKNFPSEQEVFMRNLKVGDPFTVECWINENTTVRIRK